MFSKILYCGIKYVILVTYKTQYQNLNHLQKNYTGRNDSKFAIGKYHINAMEIIKPFQVNIFMPIPFPLDYLQKNAISDLWSVQGAFQRNHRKKLGILR